MRIRLRGGTFEEEERAALLAAEEAALLAAEEAALLAAHEVSIPCVLEVRLKFRKEEELEKQRATTRAPLIKPFSELDDPTKLAEFKKEELNRVAKAHKDAKANPKAVPKVVIHVREYDTEVYNAEKKLKDGRAIEKEEREVLSILILSQRSKVGERDEALNAAIKTVSEALRIATEQCSRNEKALAEKKSTKNRRVQKTIVELTTVASSLHALAINAGLDNDTVTLFLAACNEAGVDALEQFADIENEGVVVDQEIYDEVFPVNTLSDDDNARLTVHLNTSLEIFKTHFNLTWY
jgi:hypothetical protein